MPGNHGVDPVHVWLKIDCGYHRAGVDPKGDLVVELARRISESSGLRFDGILTHSGHAYHARSTSEIGRIARQEHAVMVALSERLAQRGIEVPAVSIGSTPAMSQYPRLDGVDEVRPGNYVFYDFSQVALGSCRVGDCAVTVIASVVSTSATSDHSVIDAGALALSKDTGPSTSSPPAMGRVFECYGESRLRTEQEIYGLSQEHGLISGRLPLGSRIRILPNHSCLTVACFDEYTVVRGDEVVDRWKIHRGR
ncbi:MAG: alanine racemase [Acidobacteriota bacterium]